MEQNKHFEMDLEDDDLGFVKGEGQGSPEDYEFDTIVEKLQETVLSSGFEKIQRGFFEKNCHTFEDTDENKLEYLAIYQEYQTLIETHLLKQLASLPNFTMERFQSLLETRTHQIDEQILDMLQSSTEFSEFKAMMIDAKQDIKQEEKFEALFTIKSSKVGLKSDKKPGNIFKAEFSLDQPLSIEGLKAPLPGKGKKKN